MVPDIVSLFDPSVSPFVSSLLTEGRVGICRGTLRVADASTGSWSSQATGCMDRFKVVLPYAGCSVTWEILFNSHYPEGPPDFIFGGDDDGFEPDVEKLQTLANWQPNDPRCLLQVLDELLVEYSHYHRALMEKSSRLQFEYSSLLEQNYSPNEIEVHVTRKSEHRFGPVNFLIKLPLDFSRIPPFMTEDCPGEDTAVLLVTFQTPEDGKVTPQLYLSPRVEHVLGGSSSMRIPAFQPGGCLLDYVPLVCELLKNKIDHVVNSYEKKRECVTAFLSTFGRSVIEFDSEAYTYVSLLFEWMDFFFNITVDFPAKFPKEQPELTFQSVYHEGEDGKPYTKVFNSAPYSPRWSPTEIVERTRTYILSNISDFQRDSVKEGSLSQ